MHKTLARVYLLCYNASVYQISYKKGVDEWQDWQRCAGRTV